MYHQLSHNQLMYTNSGGQKRISQVTNYFFSNWYGNDQGVEPNLNPNRKPEWTVSFWWTRTEPEPAKFHFSEPEPNLNP